MNKKIAVITGASRGIGRAIAEHLAGLNYFVVLLSRDEKNLETVLNQIQKNQGDGIYFSVDISTSTQVRSCVDNIITNYGHIDLLFNNAGILKVGTSDLPDAEVDELLKTNLNGAIYIAKCIASQMKIQKSGYIINLSSIRDKIAHSFLGVYSASKFGLSGFSEALSKEMSLFGVKVTSICPAMIATQMAQGRKFQSDQMIEIKDIIKTVDYLLSLSKNAIPMEVVINCLPFVKMITQQIHKVYGFD